MALLRYGAVFWRLMTKRSGASNLRQEVQASTSRTIYPPGCEYPHPLIGCNSIDHKSPQNNFVEELEAQLFHRHHAFLYSPGPVRGYPAPVGSVKTHPDHSRYVSTLCSMRGKIPSQELTLD